MFTPRAALVALMLLGLFAGCSNAPRDPVVPSEAPTAAPAPTVAALVYHPRVTPAGVRLAREERRVPEADPLLGALQAIIAGPQDRGYLGAWAPETRVLSARTSGDTTTVDLSDEARRTTLSGDDVLAQADQLVWTVTEIAGHDTSVRLTIAGKPVGTLWGSVNWGEPRRRGDAYAARALVSIDAPADGAEVGRRVEVRGDADLVDRALAWRVLDQAGTPVREGTAETGAASVFSPYRFTAEVPAGTWTIEVRAAAAPDGEGQARPTATRRVVVR